MVCRLPLPSPSSQRQPSSQCGEEDISDQRQGRQMSLVTKRLERKGSDSVLLNHRHRLAETRLAGIWGHHPIQIPISQISKLRPVGRGALPKADREESQSRAWFTITYHPKSNTSDQLSHSLASVWEFWKRANTCMLNTGVHTSHLPDHATHVHVAHESHSFL